MKTVTKTISFESLGGPWVEADRLWFEAHPEEKARLRLALKGEYEAFALDGNTAQAKMYEDFLRMESDLSIASSTRKILVVKVRPGVRYRMPVLVPMDDCGEGIWNVNPETREVELLVVEVLAARILALVKTAEHVEKPDTDACLLCKCASQTGDLSFWVFGPFCFPESLCRLCLTKCPPGYTVTGISIYTAKEHTKIPPAQWPRAVRKRYERSIAEVNKLAERDRLRGGRGSA